MLADLEKKIEKVFPNVEFVFSGYALDNHIPSTHSEILAEIGQYDILVCEFDIIDKEILDAAHKLKLIICCRGGVHSVIDVPYATQKGILVKNTPARNASAVVEYILGVIFNVDRKLYESNRLILADSLQCEKYLFPENYRDSLWGMDDSSPYHRFRGKGMRNITLGVIGYGNVGRVIVNSAVLLGIRTLVYNHHPIAGTVPAGVEVVDKDYLLMNSDFVSLHCSNKSREIVMGRREFELMKNEAYFINTARGDLVDEDALIDALNNGGISGATLDVTKEEPLPVNSPLIHAKNIFLTPHIAGATDEVIQIGTDMVIYHLREYLSEFVEA